MIDQLSSPFLLSPTLSKALYAPHAMCIYCQTHAALYLIPWKARLHQRFFIFQQRNAGILSIRKEVVPEAKSRHPAKEVKVVIYEKVRGSKLYAVQTTSEIV